MEAKELRIGNYVHWKGSNVITIAGEDFTELRHDEDYFDRASPIPLTEQWLKDFRFEYDSKEEDYVINGDVSLAVNIEEYNVYIRISERAIWDDSLLIKMKHVHQLQNLYFALTGKELTK